MFLLGLVGAFAQPHYGRVQFRVNFADVTAQAVRSAAKDVPIRVTSLGRPAVLEDLDEQTLQVLAVVLQSERFRGTELDLFFGTKARRVPVTVRWENAGLEVERGPVYQPTWARTSRGIVAGRYALAAVEDGSRAWNRPLLGMVERAFERLSESERVVLEGMRLRADHAYVPEPGEPDVGFTPGAMYRADAHLIQVFDASFGPSFVGDVDHPEPVGVFMLLHEIAHAIDALAPGDPPSERFAAEVPGVTVTHYGARSKHESFAEAFALWRTDRAALMRISKDAVAFFDADKHLKPAPAVTGPTDTGP